MGTTLEGKQINQTYQGLLKTTDNAEVGGTAKEITDGKGNGTGVTLDNAGNVTATSFTGDGSGLTNLPSGAVSSVNTQTGDVVLDTDDIAEGSNEYYTDAKVEANSAVAANTAKVGITTQQASDILTNNDKVGITTQQANEIATNTLKVGITTDQANEISANTLKTGITQAQADAIVDNTAKVGITPTQASEIAANTLKTGITTQQADDIVANNAKVTRRPITAGGNTLETSESLTLTAGSNVTITEADGTVTIASTGGAGSIDLGTSTTTTSVTITNSGGTDATISEASGTAAGVMSTAHHDKLDGIAAGAEVNPTNTDGLSEGSSNLYYTEARVSANTSVAANTAKVSMVLGTTAGTALEGDTALLQLGTTSTTALAGDTTTISAQQASDITTNNAKVGITTQQANDITANNAKVSMVLGTIAGTALEGDTPLLQLGTTSTTALAGDTVIPTNNNQLTNGASYITASSTDTLTNKSGSNSQWTNDENYLTGNETVTLSGDITGSGTTAITASIANDVVGADELNVSGNGTSGQVLASDGDGTFSWADAGGSYTPNIVSGATTASKDNLYIFTASATLTLPATPSGGDSIKVSNLSGTTTCVLARNGSNIMADASDMTLDNQYASFELIYGDATRGWVVVGGN